MRSRSGVVLVGLGLMVILLAAEQPLFGQSFSFPAGSFTTTNVCANSNSPATACQILTNGYPSQPKVISGGVLRLNTANNNQHGSAWFKVQQPLATGFTTAVQFQISNTGACRGCSFPADGIALVIQNDPAGTGALGYVGNGQNISYGNGDNTQENGPGQAVLNSLAVELDTYKNSDYGDPDGNHIAVQSCGPNNSSTLSANSADHTYICPNGSLAKLALQSLPAGLSLSDGAEHTITVNYLPPGNCTTGCNNFSVYFDSTLILQTTVDLTKQLYLTGGSTAYIGVTASTGGSVENNDIVSWSFSQWPLEPITINQNVQPTTPTVFNYTSTLSATVDYSQSGIAPGTFQGLVMQGTVTSITDQTFNDLVNNTPFQGSSCQHQDTGNGTFSCVATTDLCTTSQNQTPMGSNCLGTQNPLIGVSNTYNIDPSQLPLIAPGYVMGKDNALGCGATGDNTCKGLSSIFTGINGDAITTNGHTNNFNSQFFVIFGNVQPSTTASTAPPLVNGFAGGNVTVNLNSTEIIPSNNHNPPATLPTISSINYSVSGADLPSPTSGTFTGNSGSIFIPGTVEGASVVTYAATDSSNTVESVTSNVGNSVSSAPPTLTINFDLTPPVISSITISPASPTAGQPVTASFSCSDKGVGVVLCGPAGSAQFAPTPNTGTIVVNVDNSPGVHTFTVYAQDGVGNPSTPAVVSYTVAGKSIPTITWATPNPINYKTPLSSNQLNATANVPGTFVYSPKAGAILTAGLQTLSVTFIPTDTTDYANATATVQLTVLPIAPNFVWLKPAPIVYGTPLSSKQLDARSSIPGTFVYVPPAGTILPPGQQTLAVTFTPTDNVDYVAVSAQVPITVTQPLISFSPNAIAFGAVKLGSTHSITVIVSNPGTAPLTIGSVAVSGTVDSGIFTVTNSCKTVGAGGKCNFKVTLSAIEANTFSLNVSVTDNVTGSPQQLPLTATVLGN